MVAPLFRPRRSISRDCLVPGRAAASEQIDRIEVAQAHDGREQGTGDVEVPHAGEGDITELLQPAGPIHIGGFIEVFRDRQPAGQREALPPARVGKPPLRGRDSGDDLGLGMFDQDKVAHVFSKRKLRLEIRDWADAINL